AQAGLQRVEEGGDGPPDVPAGAVPFLQRAGALPVADGQQVPAGQVLVHQLAQVVRGQLDDGEHLGHREVVGRVDGAGVVERGQLLGEVLGGLQVEGDL